MIPLVSRIFLIMQQLGFAKAQNWFCTLVCLLRPSRNLLTWVRGGSKGVGEEKTDRDGHSVAKKNNNNNYRDKYRLVTLKIVMEPLWGLRGWVLALALAISGVRTLNASFNPEIMTGTGQVLRQQGPASSLDAPKTTSIRTEEVEALGALGWLITVRQPGLLEFELSYRAFDSKGIILVLLRRGFYLLACLLL